jgi:hypothetical protein
MYLKVEVNNNCLWQQVMQSVWFSNALTLIDTVVVLISRWQWVHHCCVQSSEQHDHVTCSCCNTHWNVLMYNNISKECHTAFLTVSTTVRNQHTLTLNQNCIDVQQLMSSHLLQCDTVCTNKTLSLSRARMIIVWESEHTKQAAVDQLKNRIDISVTRRAT